MDETLLARSRQARQAIFDQLNHAPSKSKKGVGIEPVREPLSPQTPKPATEGQLDSFCQQLMSQGAKVKSVAQVRELSNAFTTMLDQFSPKGGLVWHPSSLTLPQLDGWQIQSNTPNGHTQAAITYGFGGACETGTIMMVTNNEQGAVGNFLPPIHIIILKRSTIYAHYEDLWQALDLRKDNKMPSLVHWISGPSRTADIEQKLVQGAHGPKHLGILIIQRDDEKNRPV